MILLPYLMPLAVVAYISYRYWAQAQRSAEIDSATSAWALREGLVPGTPPSAGATPTLRGKQHAVFSFAQQVVQMQQGGGLQNESGTEDVCPAH